MQKPSFFTVFWRVLLLLPVSVLCHAQALNLNGQWFAVPPAVIYSGQPEPKSAGLVAVKQLDRIGGHYVYVADLTLGYDTALVVDFKNSSVIGRFHHRIFDSRNRLIAEAVGGIQSGAPNPFFLRHGREFDLLAGQYRLVTEISSPFYLAQPKPYVDTLAHYQQAIKGGDALTLISLGILLGLMFYYAALAVLRINITDALYALFILGNLLYNGTALLVYADLFDLHWFYLISVPILFSNAIYVLFVLNLLDIRRESHPYLYGAGLVLLALFTVFIVVAGFKPDWSLELDRIGVALFMTFGLLAGVVRARQGHPSARKYLIAVLAFYALGALSISLGGLSGIYTLYIEHLGLMAVTVEALLLALVLASQFSQLRLQFEQAQEHAARDALTGLFNRRAFVEAGFYETERARRYGHPVSVVFIDLDHFKQLNDSKGHEVGDNALLEVGKALQGALRLNDQFARLGGDEFAILIPEVRYDDAVGAGIKIFKAVQSALLPFHPVTASMGLIWFGRVEHTFLDMMKEADQLMYEVKRSGKNDLRVRRYG